MNTNSAIENATLNPKARIVLRVRPLSRIMKNSAEPRLPMISKKARAMTVFTAAIVARSPGPSGWRAPGRRHPVAPDGGAR